MKEEKSIFGRLKKVLSKTRHNIFKRLLDKEIIKEEELEESLILSDVGVSTTSQLINLLKDNFYPNKESLLKAVKENLLKILMKCKKKEDPERYPLVLIVVGVNGVGKTTTIAKIAYRYKILGKKILLVAADTFRAAAIEQLKKWADNLEIDLVKHQDGADPGAVVFDALTAAKVRNIEVVIIDTAGRMHNQANLMKELKKIKNICQKKMEIGLCKVLLILDANTGQNALRQISLFHQEVGIDGLIMTKLDGTSKGGILVTISHEFMIPIEYLGIGEKFEDLIEFKAEDFVEALFDEKKDQED
ncbi:signal recognition particle-docking protein FtsY [bacterium]|nr:signal recognition particle-docking protein FtsY [bacterium]MBU1781893.1 signal recognition particle-docking protein FtsY [bacterium]